MIFLATDNNAVRREAEMMLGSQVVSLGGDISRDGQDPLDASL